MQNLTKQYNNDILYLEDIKMNFTFEFYAKQSEKELKNILTLQLKNMGYNPNTRKTYLYAKGNYPVMLIAHLDTVHRERPNIICYSEDKNVIMSPYGIGGDDRCGVFMIMQLLQCLKFKPHILFTEGEETGAIGAHNFSKSEIKPDINYMIEFDRRGSTDAVFYDCDNRNFVEFVEKYGFKEDYGTFSDISIIAPALGVAAVNLSSGYYNEHTKNEFVVMSDVEQNLKNAYQMINAKTNKFIYVEKLYRNFKAWDDYSSFLDNCKKLMFLDDSIEYIILPEGEFADASDFLIDEHNTLYWYDWDKDCAVLADNRCCVMPLTGIHKSSYDLEFAEWIDVLEDKKVSKAIPLT
jgi:hypothetical protein